MNLKVDQLRDGGGLPDFRFLVWRQEKGVGLATINRPPANALDIELVEDLHALVDMVETLDSVRVLVITGQGPFFVAGADIKMMREHMGEGMRRFMAAYTVQLQRALNRIEALPKPVVAAINGFAAGGGCELALACDFRFMAQGSARLGLPEVKLGLLPGGGGLQRLPRLIGRGQALDLLLRGSLLSAEEALEVGLAHRIFPPGELLEETLAWAGDLAQQAPLAMAEIKKCVNHGLTTDFKAGLAFDIEAQDRLLQTRDAHEGIQAFVEKRTPVFEGR